MSSNSILLSEVLDFRTSVFHSIAVGLTLTCLLAGCKNESKSSGLDLKKKDSVQSRSVPKSRLQFVDRTAESGVDAVCQNGGDAEFRTMLETLGGGVGVVDFDRDGMADFFVNGGGLISKEKEISGAASFLYRNLGDWRFSYHASRRLRLIRVDFTITGVNSAISIMMGFKIWS